MTLKIVSKAILGLFLVWWGIPMICRAATSGEPFYVWGLQLVLILVFSMLIIQVVTFTTTRACAGRGTGRTCSGRCTTRSAGS